MWEEVKPITLFLEQKNEDNSRYLLYFYSHDYELIKLREATEFNSNNKIVGSYSRLLDAHSTSKFSASYFIDKLNRNTINKMIEYYENPNLFIEYIY